jgi:hypothetical protein
MINDINNYNYDDKEENEEFEENLEQSEIEKRSIIDRNISEYGMRKFSFITPTTQNNSEKNKKNENEMELDGNNVENGIESLYVEDSYFEEDNENENESKNIPNFSLVKMISKETTVNLNLDKNNKVNDNKKEKIHRNEPRQNNLFSQSFIQIRNDNSEMILSPVKKKGNKNNNDDNFRGLRSVRRPNSKLFNKRESSKEIKNEKEQEQENDILNFSHMDYDFKNSEILKGSGMKKGKSTNNSIQIQLNNIVISHEDKKGVIKSKFKNILNK